MSRDPNSSFTEASIEKQNNALRSCGWWFYEKRRPGPFFIPIPLGEDGHFLAGVLRANGYRVTVRGDNQPIMPLLSWTPQVKATRMQILEVYA